MLHLYNIIFYTICIKKGKYVIELYEIEQKYPQLIVWSKMLLLSIVWSKMPLPLIGIYGFLRKLTNIISRMIFLSFLKSIYHKI